jgi:hypothetical protein
MSGGHHPLFRNEDPVPFIGEVNKGWKLSCMNLISGISNVMPDDDGIGGV